MNMFKSRRFWLLVLDTIVSVVLHYYGGTDVQFLVGALQPVFISVILAYTIDDTAALKYNSLR